MNEVVIKARSALLLDEQAPANQLFQEGGEIRGVDSGDSADVGGACALADDGGRFKDSLGGRCQRRDPGGDPLAQAVRDRAQGGGVEIGACVGDRLQEAHHE